MTIIARGNHRDGYAGALVDGWGTSDERVIWLCPHRHPTTKAARDCARAAAGRGITLS